MRISTDIIQSLNEQGVDVSSAWMWCDADVYDQSYRQVLEQPISLESLTLDFCRWKVSTVTIIIRVAKSETSDVLWAGQAVLIDDSQGTVTGNHNDLQNIYGESPFYHLDAVSHSLVTSTAALTGTGVLDLTSGIPSLIGIGTANGVCGLGSDSRVAWTNLPASLSGAVHYAGTWDASTNTPTLPDPATNNGAYYIVSVAGSYSGIIFAVGDACISNGTSYEKIDNTQLVTSVFGRVGAVVASATDYSAYYPRLDNTYTDPSWIGSLAWTKISGKPSALSGYGIASTDTLFDTKYLGINTNAASASKLAAARTISMTGDGTWSTSFDGSANVTGTLTLATLLTAGSAGSATAVPTLTWDAKGRITSVSSVAISIPHTQISDWSTATAGYLTTVLGDVASRGANIVYAGPNGSAGPATFRSLVYQDIPGYTRLFGNIDPNGFTIPQENANAIGWNRAAGNGEFDFITNRTNLAGGFNWYSVLNGVWSTAMTLSSGGTLYAVSSVNAPTLYEGGIALSSKYLQANQSISLTGAVYGSGTTSIATSFANTHLAGINQDLTTTSSPTFNYLTLTNRLQINSSQWGAGISQDGLQGDVIGYYSTWDANKLFINTYNNGVGYGAARFSGVYLHGILTTPEGISTTTLTASGLITANGGISGNLTGHASLDLPLTGGTMTAGAKILTLQDMTISTGANTNYANAPFVAQRNTIDGTTTTHASIGFHNCGVNAAALFYHAGYSNFWFNDYIGGLYQLWSSKDFASQAITNWTTAYNWGNHASAGYLTANQPISLKGAVTGSGTTSIATSFANTHLAGIDQDLTSSSSPTFTAMYTNSAFGSCGIVAGNADGAAYTAYNLKIKSWWGIGFESYDGVTRILMDTRTGGISTLGGIDASGLITANGGISGNLSGNATTATTASAVAWTGITSKPTGMDNRGAARLYRGDGTDSYWLSHSWSNLCASYFGSNSWYLTASNSQNDAQGGIHTVLVDYAGLSVNSLQLGGIAASSYLLSSTAASTYLPFSTITPFAIASVSINNYWGKLATLTITAQYGSASAIVRVADGGGDVSNLNYAATIKVNMKHQTAMTDSLNYMACDLESSVGINPADVRLIKTVDTSSTKTCELWIQWRQTYSSVQCLGENKGSTTFASSTLVSAPTTALSYITAGSNSNFVNILTATSAIYSKYGTIDGQYFSTNYSYAGFGHKLCTTAGNYCLLQDSSGTTFLNGSTDLHLQINNVGVMDFTSTLASIAKPLTVSGLITANGGISGNLTGTASNASALGGVAADSFVQGSNASRTTQLTTTGTSQSLLFKSGFYDSTNWTDINSSWIHMIHCAHSNDEGTSNRWSFDIAANFAGYLGNGEHYYVRTVANSAALNWRELIHSANYPSFNNFTSGLTTTTLTTSGTFTPAVITSSGVVTINATHQGKMVSTGRQVNFPTTGPFVGFWFYLSWYHDAYQGWGPTGAWIFRGVSTTGTVTEKFSGIVSWTGSEWVAG